jgi:hypothetical protein
MPPCVARAELVVDLGIEERIAGGVDVEAGPSEPASGSERPSGPALDAASPAAAAAALRVSAWAAAAER